MNKIWQWLLSTLILISSISTIKITEHSEITIKQNNFKTENKIIDLNNIKFAIQQFNFSKFTIEALTEWISKAINLTFESYLHLDDVNDFIFIIETIDDSKLEHFINKSDYHLPIKITSQNPTKAKNETTLELINDWNANDAPSEPSLIRIIPNKPLPRNKNQSLILMTTISILTISFVIIIIFMKSRLKKGIGIKKNKNGKNSYLLKNKNKVTKSAENPVIKLSRQEKNIIKMKNKIKKYQTKIKKAKKIPKVKRKDNFNEKSNSKIN